MHMTKIDSFQEEAMFFFAVDSFFMATLLRWVVFFLQIIDVKRELSGVTGNKASTVFHIG